MSDLRSIIENARFIVPSDTPYEGVACLGKAYKNGQFRTRVQQFFYPKDILIDAVTIDFWRTSKQNRWSRKIPMPVIDYCYQCIPYRKMCFVLDLRDDEATADYMVYLLDDRYIKPDPQYEALYKSRIAKLAKI